MDKLAADTKAKEDENKDLNKAETKIADEAEEEEEEVVEENPNAFVIDEDLLSTAGGAPPATHDPAAEGFLENMGSFNF